MTMSKTLRIVLAALAAVLLVGMTSVAALSPEQHWKTAGPDMPEGG
jgi:outer membrane biogenesis lipoprotein LolB